jgi:DNA helicase II / ATP-dependent DNA helicase PcrA
MAADGRFIVMPDPTPQQEIDLLAAQGHVLVSGGPGSGKTTLALRKALSCITAGLKLGQSILFLSFSRAAVGRLLEAGAATIPPASKAFLSVQTFHGFCWGLLSCHGYLLGAPKTLQILMPHDERALSLGIERSDPEWAEWEQKREALFFEEGKIAFDLFAPMTLRLLRESPAIKSLIAQQHPVIIVDEAQDTGEHAWDIIRALKDRVQVICLADPEQQIFDHLPGVGPERIEAIRRELVPLEVDLGQQNNRSPGTEIAIFGNDLLQGRARGSAYDGVSRFGYNPKTDTSLNLVLRKSLAVLYRKVRARTGARADSCVILAPSGRDVAAISAALSNGERPVPHKVVFDEARALLASRFAAYVLEPKLDPTARSHVIESLEFLVNIEQSAGTIGGRKNADDYRRWAADYANGKAFPKKGIASSLVAMISALKDGGYTGDPRVDWLRVKDAFRSSENKQLLAIAGHLDYLVAFGRGRFLAANLASIWRESGTYAGARSVFDAALAQDSILESSQDLNGIHVMTIHRAKGKQFDGVIVYRKGVASGPRQWRSSLVWRDDVAPYTRSRKILRVAVTRARKHVLILDPPYPACPLLAGHIL